MPRHLHDVQLRARNTGCDSLGLGQVHVLSAASHQYGHSQMAEHSRGLGLSGMGGVRLLRGVPVFIEPP